MFLLYLILVEPGVPFVVGLFVIHLARSQFELKHKDDAMVSLASDKSKLQQELGEVQADLHAKQKQSSHGYI